MDATFSIFPKFYRHLSAAQLGELIRGIGLDTTNLVIRDGYWVTRAGLAEEVPAFLRTMAAAGLKVSFATAGFTPAELADDPTPLRVLADNGIAEFRMGYFRLDEGGDVRGALRQARSEMEQLVEICRRAGIRAIYQVHHGTLVPSASAAFALVDGLDPRCIGVMIDPGNENFEGYERWPLAVGLLGEHLRAVGIKDTAVVRQADRAGDEDKGWRRTWATLDEGETNWYALVRALKAGDFAGHFVWMPFYDEDDPKAMTAKLRREVAYLRKVVADVEAE